MTIRREDRNSGKASADVIKGGQEQESGDILRILYNAKSCRLSGLK